MINDNIADIVEKAKNGDSDAFGKLFEISYNKAYYTALKITKNEHDAQDLIQDGYVKAFTSLSSLKDNSKFISWLNCIVANNCRNYLVKKKPSTFSQFEDDDSDFDFVDTLEDEDEGVLPESVVDSKETKRMVTECINKLPEQQQICVMMFYYDELSVKEIAQALNIPEGTVKSRLNKARNTLRKEFEEIERKGTKLHGIPIVALIRFAFENDSSRLKKGFAYKRARKYIFSQLERKAVISIAGKSIIATVFGNKAVAAIVAVVAIAGAAAASVSIYNNYLEERDKYAGLSGEAEILSQSDDNYIDADNQSSEKERYCDLGDLAVCDYDKSVIYYIGNDGIYMADYNGNNPKLIFDNQPYNLFYTDKLYFVWEDSLFSYDGELSELGRVKSRYIFAYDNGHFVGITENKSSAYFADIDTLNETELNIDGTDLQYDNGFIYFRELNNDISRIEPKENTNAEKVVAYKSNQGARLPYCISGNRVYYTEFDSDETGIVYCYNLSTGEKGEISLNTGIVDFAVNGERIYCVDYNDRFFSCDLKGENQSIIDNGQFSFIQGCEEYSVWYNVDENKTIIIDNSNTVIKEINALADKVEIVGNNLFYCTGSGYYADTV